MSMIRDGGCILCKKNIFDINLSAILQFRNFFQKQENLSLYFKLHLPISAKFLKISIKN